MDPFKVLPFLKIGIGGGVGLYALRAFEALRLLGFWLTVIDVTTEGLVVWTSLAYQWSGCSQPGSEQAQAHAITGNVLLFSGVWLPVSDWIWDQADGVPTSGQGFFLPRGKSSHISFTMAAHPPPDVPGCDGATIQFRLRNMYTGQTWHQESIRDNNTQITISGNVINIDATQNNGDELVVEYFIEGCGYHIIDSGSLTYTSHSITSSFDPQKPCPQVPASRS